MKRRITLLLLLFLPIAPLLSAATPELDGSDVNRELMERGTRVNSLSLEDQLKLRAAERAAAEDPAVKAALSKRDEAIRDFRAAVRAAMVKADPSVAPLLEKVAVPGARGTSQPTPTPPPQ